MGSKSSASGKWEGDVRISLPRCCTVVCLGSMEVVTRAHAVHQCYSIPQARLPLHSKHSTRNAHSA